VLRGSGWKKQRTVGIGALAGQPIFSVTAHYTDCAVAVSLANCAAFAVVSGDEQSARDSRAQLADQITTLQAQLVTVTKQIDQTQAQIADAKARQQDTTALEQTLSSEQAAQQAVIGQLTTAH